MATSKIAISIDEEILEQVDRLVREKVFPSRSRAIQDAVREKLGRLARSQTRTLKNTLIRYFMHRYDVDLAEAQRTQVTEYRSFNDFFTRSLKPDARPLPDDARAIVSPADGWLTDFFFFIRSPTIR